MSEYTPLDDAGIEYLYELYHKNLLSLGTALGFAPNVSTADSSSEPTYKTYRRGETVPLAEPEDSALVRALRQRASYTEPTERRSITDTELATLLTYAYGEVRETDKSEPRRPVASGGACYPLELYPIVVDSPDIEAGIYHYNVRAGALDRLWAGDCSEWIRDTWTWIGDDDATSVVVVITARPGRSAAKYGELGYLFAGMEAGAVIQNLQLVATDLGIGSRPHNGLNYRALRDRLGLRSDEYLMSTVVFAGTAPDDWD